MSTETWATRHHQKPGRTRRSAIGAFVAGTLAAAVGTALALSTSEPVAAAPLLITPTVTADAPLVISLDSKDLVGAVADARSAMTAQPEKQVEKRLSSTRNSVSPAAPSGTATQECLGYGCSDEQDALLNKWESEANAGERDGSQQSALTTADCEAIVYQSTLPNSELAPQLRSLGCDETADQL